jgi:glycosyltransferase involved in cell wall biosynthesis
MSGAATDALRVLHLDTERGWRGGERQTLWLARELGRLGHASFVAARPRGPLALAAADAGLPVVPCAPLAPADAFAAWRLRRAILRDEFHLVHAHTGNAVTLGALATLATGVPMVVTRRVDFPLNRGPGTRWKYARAAAVVAISRRVRDVLVSSGVPAERVDVVPDGVDLSRAMAVADDRRLRELGVTAGVPLVVMVAALVGHKDPLTFVRAVSAARAGGASIQALLVGDGFLIDRVRAEVARLGLDGTLTVAGWQDDADALIAASDIVVLSSLEEGQGSVLLDAMQCGKPVAATRAGGIADVVVDGETGLLVHPGDAPALGSALARLCADSAMRQRMGSAGRARVRNFGIDRTAALTVAVYRRVLSGRPRGD